MAIHVICPGCMARFEVSDRFAGKKGPCPKCGHLIEIPKENVVVHAPDELMIDGKKVKNPDFIRPIERKSFSFTGRAVLVNLVTAAVVLTVATVFHFIHFAPLAMAVGVILSLAVAFPLVKYGYMVFRDQDDLEIFLGGQLNQKSAVGAAGFVGFWILFEILLWFMNPGAWSFFYIIPVVILASFIPLVLFDLDFSNALAIVVVFALLVILLRGIMFADGGWIWEIRHSRSAAPVPAVVTPGTAAEGGDSTASDAAPAGSAAPTPAPQAPVKLDKNAPDPTRGLRRR